MAWTVWKTIIQEVEIELGDHISAPVFQGTNTEVGKYHMKYDPSTDKLINLSNATASSGSPTSATLLRTNTAYQVPAGKKYVFVASVTGIGVTNTQGKVRSSVTVDTADGTVLHDQTAFVNSTGKKTTDRLTVLANQFLTAEQVSGANFRIGDIIGFETDA